MSGLDLSQLDDRPGSLVAEVSTPEPADLPVEPEQAAETPAPETPPAASTPEPDPDALFDQLTPDQRKAFLRKYSPDEIRTDEVVSGLIGDLVKKNLREARQQQGKQTLDTLAQEARESRDPSKALEYVDAEAQAQAEAAQGAAWQEASEVYEFLKSDPLTEPLLEGITGRDYGKLANYNGTLAALMFESDMARNVKNALPRIVEAVKANTEAALTERLTVEITAKLEKQYESEVKPALAKEARAKAGLEVPPPDTGNGKPPGVDTDESDVGNYAAGRTKTAPSWVLEAVGIKR